MVIGEKILTLVKEQISKHEQLLQTDNADTQTARLCIIFALEDIQRKINKLLDAEVDAVAKATEAN